MSLLDEVLKMDNLVAACSTVLRSVLKNQSKRYENENLYKKAKQVRKKDRTAPLSDLMIAQIKMEMGELRKKVREGRYSRKPLYLHREPKPKGGTRIIMIHAKLEEKIFEQAVYQVIGRKLHRILDNGMSYCGVPKTTESIKKLGIFAAHQDICATLESGTWWILKADIEKFFDKLERQRVLDLLKKHLQDDSLDAFFSDWVSIRIENPGDDYEISELGVPQGSCLSGLISNLYLTDFDLSQKQQDAVPCFRYADDLLFACETEAKMKSVEEEMTKYLNIIGLNIKQSKTERFEPGKTFGVLGYNYSNYLVSVPETRITKWIESLGKDFEKIGKAVYRKKISGKYLKKDVEALIMAQKSIRQKLLAYSSLAYPYKNLPENIHKQVVHRQAFSRLDRYMKTSVSAINRILKKKTMRIVDFHNRKGHSIWPFRYPLIVGIQNHFDN